MLHVGLGLGLGLGLSGGGALPGIYEALGLILSTT